MTMAEYIEREAISEEIRKYYYKNPPNFSYSEGFDRGLNRAQRAILDAPAAYVAEVRHGRWIDAYPDIEPNPMFMYGICSECGFEQGISKYLNYCPDCGAKMDGGDNKIDNV